MNLVLRISSSRAGFLRQIQFRTPLIKPPGNQFVSIPLPSAHFDVQFCGQNIRQTAEVRVFYSPAISGTPVVTHTCSGPRLAMLSWVAVRWIPGFVVDMIVLDACIHVMSQVKTSSHSPTPCWLPLSHHLFATGVATTATTPKQLSFDRRCGRPGDCGAGRNLENH